MYVLIISNYNVLVIKKSKLLKVIQFKSICAFLRKLIVLLLLLNTNCIAQNRPISKKADEDYTKILVKSNYKNYHINTVLASGEIPYQQDVENSLRDTTIEILTIPPSFFLKSNKNVYLNLNKNEHNKMLSIFIDDVDSLYINEAMSKKISIKNNAINYNEPKNDEAIVILNSEINDLDLSKLEAAKFMINKSSLGLLNFHKTIIKRHLSLSNSSIESIDFEYAGLPDTIVFTNLDLRKLKNEIDLTNVYNCANAHINSVLVFANTDLNRFKIPFDRFIICIDKNQSYEQKSMLYQQLLKQLETAGLSEKFEGYDKEFKELKLLHNNSYFINWISKYWWDYGYDKGKVFMNSIIIFIIFLGLNLSLFPILITVYYPKKLQEHRAKYIEIHSGNNKVRSTLSHLFNVFLYTSYLFWGLKLDLQEIEIRFSAAIFIIISQYIAGIVCIAYIANFIITK